MFCPSRLGTRPTYLHKSIKRLRAEGGIGCIVSTSKKPRLAWNKARRIESHMHTLSFSLSLSLSLSVTLLMLREEWSSEIWAWVCIFQSTALLAFRRSANDNSPDATLPNNISSTEWYIQIAEPIECKSNIIIKYSPYFGPNTNHKQAWDSSSSPKVVVVVECVFLLLWQSELESCWNQIIRVIHFRTEPATGYQY